VGIFLEARRGRPTRRFCILRRYMCAHPLAIHRVGLLQNFMYAPSPIQQGEPESRCPLLLQRLLNGVFRTPTSFCTLPAAFSAALRPGSLPSPVTLPMPSLTAPFTWCPAPRPSEALFRARTVPDPTVSASSLVLVPAFRRRPSSPSRWNGIENVMSGWQREGDLEFVVARRFRSGPYTPRLGAAIRSEPR
jgi:hypothetical protein